MFYEYIGIKWHTLRFYFADLLGKT